MNKKRILLLLLCVFIVAACQPDPRREAAAYATRSQADQQAADAEQARRIQEEQHQVEMAKAQLDQEIRQANKQSTIMVRRFLIITFGIFGCILLASALLSSARAYHVAAVGVADAVAVAAMVRARQLPLDPKTRQYPIYLPAGQNNKQLGVNFNVHGVLDLGQAHDPDRQMISTSGATQVAGVLASEAAKSKDPAGMAMINPPIVHTQVEDITLGSDYLPPTPAGKE